MRIAYICNYLGPSFTKNYCKDKSYSTSATLKSTAIARALLKSGHSVTIYSPGITVCNRYIKPHYEVISYPEGTIKIVYSPIFSFRKLSLINSLFLHFTLLKESPRNNFDAVIFYNISFDALLNIKIFKSKLKILEYEDNIFNNSLKGKNRGLWWKTRLFNCIINKIDGTIIVGKSMLSNFLSMKKVHIPGAISDDVTNSLSYPSKQLRIQNGIVISLAGGVHYSKGADLVIQALDYIEEPVELRFYGSGIFDSYTQNLIINCPKKHKIKNCGYVEHSELIKLLETDSSILINSTRNMGVEPNSEGYPFKMLEYAAIGRPIVSSPIGHLNEEFDKNIIFYENEDPKEIAKAINYVINNYNDCINKSLVLQKLAICEYSIQGISTKINTFLNNLENNNDK